MVKSAIWTRCVAPEEKNEELDERQAALITLEGTID
jgi:hypothetical protein